MTTDHSAEVSTPRAELAAAMLRHAQCPSDPVAAETVWQNTPDSARQHWLDRADAVLADLARSGLQVIAITKAR